MFSRAVLRMLRPRHPASSQDIFRADAFAPGQLSSKRLRALRAASSRCCCRALAAWRSTTPSPSSSGARTATSAPICAPCSSSSAPVTHSPARGSVETTTDGIPVFISGLRGADTRPLGSLVIELGGGGSSRSTPSMIVSMLRPVLDCLEGHMGLEHSDADRRPQRRRSSCSCRSTSMIARTRARCRSSFATARAS